MKLKLHGRIHYIRWPAGSKKTEQPLLRFLLMLDISHTAAKNSGRRGGGGGGGGLW